MKTLKVNFVGTCEYCDKKKGEFFSLKEGRHEWIILCAEHHTFLETAKELYFSVRLDDGDSPKKDGMTETLQIKIDRHDKTRFYEKAMQKGLAVPFLVRAWVNDFLKEDEGSDRNDSFTSS